MKPGRIVAVVIGALIALPSLALVIGGTAFTIGYAIEREDDGYFDATLERLSSATAAITTEDADLRADPGPPDWFVDFVDVSLRLQVSGGDDRDLFVAVGQSADVDAFLGGVARDEIFDIDKGRDVKYRSFAGTSDAPPPGDEAFWVASASGPGDIELTWDVVEGEWAAVLMNADGSPGVVADVTAGIRSGALLGIAIAMLAVGAVFLAIAVTIIVFAVRRPTAEVEAVPDAALAEPAAPRREPVRLEAGLDEPLSPWLWLVKWFLAIPHLVVLFFLWVAFALLTVVAFFSILFTGRYPRGIFDFNVGVLRWSWRVSYYAASGGLGTDRYPPFTTEAVDGYPATLDIEYPGELSRGLVLVKWWLLAIPHYIVLAFIAGGGPGNGGLVMVLVIFAAIALLFTGRYPTTLFDLVIGFNRWAYRVLAYAALMTDQYPPFRLDQGGAEPVEVTSDT